MVKTEVGYILYKNILELPLSAFITCIVDDNLYALIKSGEGKPAKEELEILWINMQQEYSDAIGSSEQKFYYSLLKDYALKKSIYNSIIIIINCLSQAYSKDLCDKLNKINQSKFAFNIEDLAAYRNDLERSFVRSKSQKIKLDLLSRQIEEVGKKFDKEQGTKKVTREFYSSVLITLSDHAKYQLQDSISVFEFCDRLNRYNIYCDQLRSQIKNK